MTTGIPTIDYFITFDAEIAAAEAHYTEQLLRLPGLLPYQNPVPLGPGLDILRALHRPTASAELARRRREHGLPPPGMPVFLCIQAPYKYHPTFDAAVRRILQAIPTAIFALLRGKARHWTDTLLRRFNSTLGLEFAARVLVLPRIASPQMPGLLALADVVLDTWPYGGGVTSFEALSVGRPLVTLAHSLLPGRFTYAFYFKMGFLDCVAFDQDEYVAIAVALGSNSSMRAAASHRILATVDVLFDDQVARIALEEHLHEALARLGEATHQSPGDGLRILE